MGINGVPLHPLVVHAAVVFTPLAALAVITFFVMQRWRALLRWPTIVLAVMSGFSIVAAYLSGKNFLHNNSQLLLGAHGSLVRQHQHRGGQLLWLGIAFAVVAVVAVLLASVPAPAGSRSAGRAAAQPVLANVAAVVAVLLAVGVLVLVVITGDLAARAVWSGFKV